MKLEVGAAGAVAILRIHGRLTIGPDLERLRDTVQDLLHAGTRAFVFDLEPLEYIESAGLGEIVACRRVARDHGGRLALARPRAKVRDLIELTRIDRLIDTYPDLDAAVAAVAAG